MIIYYKRMLIWRASAAERKSNEPHRAHVSELEQKHCTSDFSNVQCTFYNPMILSGLEGSNAKDNVLQSTEHQKKTLNFITHNYATNRICIAISASITYLFICILQNCDIHLTTMHVCYINAITASVIIFISTAKI